MHFKNVFLLTPFSESQTLNKQKINTMNWNLDKHVSFAAMLQMNDFVCI